MVREEKLWVLCEQMARCVMHCHDKNIVHLDVKPSNFLVDRRKQIKLTDFGVSVDLS